MADAPRITDYLAFADERPFIDKAFEHTLGDADRLAYATLVEARDPDRAEWLRLEVALHGRAADDPDTIARFIALARKIGLDFTNVLLRDRIMNCGSESAKAGPPKVRFAFVCSKRWETLAPSDESGVRHCQQCSEPVHYCGTVADAETRALAGQCIAIPKELTNGGVESLVLGRPDPVGDWAGRLFALGRRSSTPTAGFLLILYSSRDPSLVGDRVALGAAPAVTTIGRGSHNTVVLDDDTASRSHARVEQRDDGWWITDCGSTHGTYVNDVRVQEVLLQPGDRVQIGGTVLRLDDG